MATDIRIHIGFFSHPKTRKLRRALGDAGVVALIELWCYVAINRPRGNLDGLGEDDIEIAANWQGTPGAFYAQLFALRWICTDEEGILHVHDWEEHNPWVYAAPERSEKAKKAINARWDKAKQARGDADASYAENTERILDVYSTYTERITKTDENDGLVIPLSSPLLSSPLLSSPNHSSPNPTKPETLSDESLTHAHGRAREAHPRSTPEVPQKSEVFERWWALYPGKGSKANAVFAWGKIVRTDEQANEILAATASQIEHRSKLVSRGSWVPLWRNAARWLNEGGWEDEPLQESPERKRQGTRADANRHALAAWIGGTDDEA